MKSFRAVSAGAFLFLVLSMGCLASANAAATESLPYSNNPVERAAQKEVHAVVNEYQQALNKGDTQAILSLFAPNSVAEWNDKRTYATRQQKIDGYNALFKIAKFTTRFAYDAIDVWGDTALVRTHHHKGQAVIENGKSVLDYNREVFVLRKIDGQWKIVLYTFNSDPVQGEG